MTWKPEWQASGKGSTKVPGPGGLTPEKLTSFSASPTPMASAATGPAVEVAVVLVVSATFSFLTSTSVPSES